MGVSGGACLRHCRKAARSITRELNVIPISPRRNRDAQLGCRKAKTAPMKHSCRKRALKKRDGHREVATTATLCVAVVFFLFGFALLCFVQAWLGLARRTRFPTTHG